MNILVIGSGGREHALVWKISQSSRVEKIYCAPGNPGIGQLAQCVNISVEDLDGLVSFAVENAVDLTVVGPEVPLVLGICDKFEEKGLKVIGPNKICSQFEGSKAFTKKFLEKYDISTAAYREYTDLDSALKGLDEFDLPVVVKADGLAAGKGVIIAETKDIARQTLKEMMGDLSFGEAGTKVVLEEFLSGTEASILCFVDGKNIVPMESAQDYKRIGDNDQGNNTGGMGTYSPNRLFDSHLNEIVKREVLDPIIKGFKDEGLDYKGILFIGLMIEENKPKVLEFNVRFGDPETQSVLVRLETDIVDIFESMIKGTLSTQDIRWSNKSAVTIVLASGGYPDRYEKGKVITGLEQIENSIVFHAGTKEKEGKIITDGGRVLGVTSIGDTTEEARDKAYEDVKKISFEGMQYRRDIAY
ncbi:phosphoribosylamine--glycine ligase [Alkalibaculum bacchi]|uniref:Phosphoribosylamine--glycine ligase n=1 Tax=Alkalibaculum bacchi TaxID=645887 RepID=A0A366IB47_9FIRM|nr:phosphoribosylamine--glycine ligase [Alkalibaculum bacchi]RBP67470.1 phosphoribosylamine--glycine ligase [Alkalibaculum bacchi]